MRPVGFLAQIALPQQSPRCIDDRPLSCACDEGIDFLEIAAGNCASDLAQQRAKAGAFGNEVPDSGGRIVGSCQVWRQ
jgi:hypothetical protein